MSLSDKINDAITGGRSQAFLSDGINDVLLNTVITYSESVYSDVSSHTIEDGANIEDHVSNNPKSFSISAVLSDNDYDLLDPSGFTNLTIEDRFSLLESWREYKAVLIYYGHEFDIEDVIITSVTKDKNKDTGSGWEISIDFQEVKTASYMTAQFSANATENQNAVTQKGAAAKGTDAKAGTPEAAKSESILSGIF